MGNAAHERHTFHILQRLLEAMNVSVIEDYLPEPHAFAKGPCPALRLAVSCTNRIIYVYTCITKRIRAKCAE